MFRKVRMKCLELPHWSLVPSHLLKMQVRLCLLSAQSNQWLFFSHSKKKKKAKVCKKLQSLCDMPILTTSPTPSAPRLSPQPHWPLCNSLNHEKPSPLSASLPFCPPGMLLHRGIQDCAFSSSGLCSETLYQEHSP